jgi:hypothetical protein
MEEITIKLPANRNHLGLQSAAHLWQWHDSTNGRGFETGDFGYGVRVVKLPPLNEYLYMRFEQTVSIDCPDGFWLPKPRFYARATKRKGKLVYVMDNKWALVKFIIKKLWIKFIT